MHRQGRMGPLHDFPEAKLRGRDVFEVGVELAIGSHQGGGAV
jgi:hypothetical protein